MKYTQVHDGLDDAKSATLYSPTVTLVTSGDESKILIKEIDDVDTEMKIVGDTIDTLKVVRKYPELVDLGLPSGTLWMKYNLGVDSEELTKAQDWYGLYYQWAETTGYKDASGSKKFSWADYSLVIRSITDLVRAMNKDKEINGTHYDAFSNETDTIYALQSSYSFIFTYDEANDKMVSIADGGATYSTRGITGVYFVDWDMTTLDTEHDAVSAFYGSEYHMPTKNQIEELKNNTTHRLVENYNGVSGLNGMILTSSINDEELFIPFSGVYQNGSNIYVGGQAGIISNQVRVDFPKTFYYLHLNNDNAVILDERERALGYTLRGVK